MVRAVLYDTAIPATRRLPTAPHAIQAILDRLLAKDRTARYPDCCTLHADLEAFIQSTGEATNGFALSRLVAHLARRPRRRSRHHPHRRGRWRCPRRHRFGLCAHQPHPPERAGGGTRRRLRAPAAGDSRPRPNGPLGRAPVASASGRRARGPAGRSPSARAASVGLRLPHRAGEGARRRRPGPARARPTEGRRRTTGACAGARRKRRVRVLGLIVLFAGLAAMGPTWGSRPHTGLTSSPAWACPCRACSRPLRRSPPPRRRPPGRRTHRHASDRHADSGAGGTPRSTTASPRASRRPGAAGSWPVATVPSARLCRVLTGRGRTVRGNDRQPPANGTAREHRTRLVDRAGVERGAGGTASAPGGRGLAPQPEPARPPGRSPAPAHRPERLPPPPRVPPRANPPVRPASAPGRPPRPRWRARPAVSRTRRSSWAPSPISRCRRSRRCGWRARPACAYGWAGRSSARPRSTSPSRSRTRRWSSSSSTPGSDCRRPRSCR
jgi:hypothetical protein